MVTKKKKTSRKTKKKVVKRRKIVKRKQPAVKRTVKHESDIHVEKVLIENFVALQKVMVNLSSKFEDLSINIKKLLDLFENAAKSLAKDGPDPSAKKEAVSIMKKLDSLADQNKLIARGLTLMHEKNTPLGGETYKAPQSQMAPQTTGQPTTMPTQEKKGVGIGGYQKSISDM